MNCPNCNTENTGTSKFCIKCGTALKNSAETLNTYNKSSENLIIIGLGINLLAFLLQLLTNFIIRSSTDNNWTNMNWRDFSLLINFIYLIGTILIPIALKNKRLKIIGIILVLIPSCYWIFERF